MSTTAYQPDSDTQHVDFRVFVYRLDIKGDFNIGGRSFPINRILTIDSSDPDYATISNHFNKQENFQEFLKSLYDVVNLGLNSGMQSSEVGWPALFANKSIFTQLDITPLVTSVNTSIKLEESNTCTINIVDPSRSDFGISQLGSYINSVPQQMLGNGPNLFTGETAGHLQGFSFREFDLVRVLSYSRIGQGLPERMLAFADKKIGENFCFTPTFTGLVSSISRASTPGNVSAISASCVGMSRMLIQTVITFNKALGDVILKKGDPNLVFLTKNLNLFGNTMQNKSSEQVFTKIMREYFIPVIIPQVIGGAPVDAIGVPSVSKDYWAAAQVTVSKTEKQVEKVVESDSNVTRTEFSTESVEVTSQNVIPFFPSLVMYHMLKFMNSEPIFMLDDALDSVWGCENDTLGLPSATASDYRTKEDYRVYLNPYLTLARDSYEMFDSSYMSPWDIFGEVRNKTFYEIFEDRTGCFHFRFPRYNSTGIRHFLSPRNIFSATTIKDDSAVYNSTLAQPMMKWYGKLEGMSGSVSLDRLSIMRFGMRAPQNVENPNATSAKFAMDLANFMNRYYSAKSSRKATVSCSMDPSINVGEQVVFTLNGFIENKSGSEAIKFFAEDGGSYSSETFVGYVSGIDESISVGGEFKQTLSLSFVRPASVAESMGGSLMAIPAHTAAGMLEMSLDKTKEYASYTDPNRLDILSRLRKMSENVKLSDQTASLVVRPNLSDYLLTDINNDIFPNARFASIPYMADPLYLASRVPISLAEAKIASAISAGNPDISKISKKQKLEILDSTNKAIEDKARSLMRFLVIGKYLDNVIEKMGNDKSRNFFYANSIGEMRERANRFKSHFEWSHDVIFHGGKNILFGEFSFQDDFINKRSYDYSSKKQLVLLSADMAVRLMASLYDGRDGADGFIARYNRLFNPGPQTVYNDADKELFNRTLDRMGDSGIGLMKGLVYIYSESQLARNETYHNMLMERLDTIKKLELAPEDIKSSVPVADRNMTNPSTGKSPDARKVNFPTGAEIFRRGKLIL